MDRSTARHSESRQPRGRGVRGAFTIVELLIVVGIIIALLTIIIVALAASSTYAAEARTAALMQSMKQGVVQFERDLNQLPAVLDGNRDPFPAPDPTDTQALQQWYSLTSPAEFLLGYGGEPADGVPGLGLRDPGPDGVWGAVRNSGTRSPKTSGRIYGPYLELNDDRLLGALVGGTPDDPVIALPTDANYDRDAPKVILDYWGRPIRYYRRHPFRQAANPADLGDVFALRPFSIDPGKAAVGLQDNRGDTATTYALKAAEFAFHSTGPDKFWNPEIRYDDPDDSQNDLGTAFFNQDNIVEIGP